MRGAVSPERGWRLFVRERSQLFRNHPQSPIEPASRDEYAGTPFLDYDPAFRVLSEMKPLLSTAPRSVELAADGTLTLSPVAALHFTLATNCVLTLYRVHGYGGGLFLPFRDQTAAETTYGGGRYLLDTIKGADLGMQDGRLVLDCSGHEAACAGDGRTVGYTTERPVYTSFDSFVGAYAPDAEVVPPGCPACAPGGGYSIHFPIGQVL